MDIEQNEGLKREIGIIGVASNVINNVVGGGIFLIPAIIAASLGGASIIAYLLCGLILFTVMLCFAEASSRITRSGGAYAYVENAFGHFSGFLTTFLFVFGFGLLSDAAIANGMADMLAIPFPIFSQTFYRGIFFLLVFSWYAYINIRGVKHGMQMVKLITVIKLIPLIALICIGIFSVSFGNLKWEALPSVNSLGEASLILFFAFIGGEAALNMSGEMKNPRRTAPVGLLLGIGFVVVFYIAIQLVAQGVLGADLKNHEAAPLAAVANVLIGPLGVSLLIGTAIISIFGNLGTSPLVYPRLIFAGAKDGLLPKILSKIHSRYATPFFAIIVYEILSFVVSTAGGFKQLAIISSASMLLIYLGVVLATFKFRLTNKTKTSGTFKIPGGLTIPTIALIIIIWFLSHLTSEEAIGITIFAGALTVLYFSRYIVKKKRRANSKS